MFLIMYKSFRSYSHDDHSLWESMFYVFLHGEQALYDEGLREPHGGYLPSRLHPVVQKLLLHRGAVQHA